MDHDPNIFRDSSQVIQEVEEQLERILQRKFRDVDSELLERINREKEAARLRKEAIERDFEKEKTSLHEYRAMVREYEEQRAGLLNEARDRFQKVLKFQAEIEALAKSTVDEIKRVNEIQDRLEGIRQRTSERAAFLKNDLRERFGIVAEVMDETEPVKAVGIDLDEELEKLRKIKDLLAIESAAAGLGRMGDAAAAEDELARLDADARHIAPDIPGLQDLIAGRSEAAAPAAAPQPGPAPEPDAAPPSAPASAPAPEAAPAPEPAPVPATEPEPEAAPSAAPPAPPAPAIPASVTEKEIEAALETYRHTEPADGMGEVHYFQKDRLAVADPEKLLAAVDRTIEEGQRLSLKLGQTESPKDQFFIKQELINWQEGLRALFLRVVKMCEKNAWVLPRFTEDILNPQVLRRLLERLSMENWSNLEEFAAFAAGVSDLRQAFMARTMPRLPYLRALRDEVEEG